MVWEKYDSTTWGYEWQDLLALIKAQDTPQGTYTGVVGTVQEALYVLHDTELNSIKARAMRAMVVINNGYDIHRVTIWNH